MSDAAPPQLPRGRLFFVAGLLALAGGALLVRLLELHLLQGDFLQNQGDARYLRVVSVAAHRGMITDRNGEPLAVSTPVDSVWVNPKEFINGREQWRQLAKLLELTPDSIERLMAQRMDKEFVYLRRQIPPELGERVMALAIPGVSLQREYRRYYPSSEVGAHVVGFTNVDDVGQEGVELMLDNALRGEPGAKRVLKDRLGRIIANVESISDPRPGHDVRLSIDRRLQYLAYRELKAAVLRNRAKAGTAVIIDVQSGEVLAAVNQPAYNPNNREDLAGARYRNRAVTDVFEPGSTVKPFTIAMALESGKYRPDSRIDTSPGLIKMASYTIRDHHNLGTIDLTTLLQKSSNVGASRVALSLESKSLWDAFTHVGFGYGTGSGFPGEASGLLKHYRDWRPVEHATLSYGYGMSVTALQLAQAYTVLAGDGRLRPVTFLAREANEIPAGVPAFKAETMQAVRTMLESVTQEGGTGTLARVSGYRVAGKTGTVRKLGPNGYSDENYFSLFAGMAPASNPRLAMVVIIDEPTGDQYYGGAVSAPVFGRVIDGALRLMNIPPDDIKPDAARLAMAEGTR
ncbi:MAG TPA: penicillin-binding transpeptidase domain-containing protein [Gammaproteobacteria bacterium]